MAKVTSRDVGRLGGIAEIISFKPQETPTPSPVGCLLSSIQKDQGAESSCFPTSGSCQRSDPKAASSLGGAKCSTLSGPHLPSPHTLPKTLRQTWVPIKAFHCRRTASSRAGSWGSRCESHFCHQLTCCVPWVGHFPSLSLDFSALTHRVGLDIHLF